jgi:hypothetical protein
MKYGMYVGSTVTEKKTKALAGALVTVIKACDDARLDANSVWSQHNKH